MAMVLLALITLLLLGWLLGQPYWRRWQRQRLLKQPFPHSWRQILKRRLPYFRALPADLQLKLKKLIQLFVAEKDFVGCAGLVIDDEIRVTIAAQACLLLLGRPNDLYPGLRQILVYPAAFVVPNRQPDGAGIVHDGAGVLLGESWGQGQVILSWQDSLKGAADPFDGHNVVIHEFAHQLDQQKGYANGAPVLGAGLDLSRWSAVFQQSFARLQQQLNRGQLGVFDPYAATNPAEFFAVASEVFFEQPHALQQQEPELYQQLQQFYRLNPVLWL
ncbi:M90 family metallopeptidase [Alkalimonas sp.]|uniref:M90 family metallopeptidase n=1 Tax=Alkalimonas sp. TaxID=1872453 RepID=UPI00263BE6E8|nr:M90 family metallopeptidase [Alkalimonas sp.]MCC5825540.1 zinc-dependent peptidase [Alkalimonas sp.]